MHGNETYGTMLKLFIASFYLSPHFCPAKWGDVQRTGGFLPAWISSQAFEDSTPPQPSLCFATGRVAPTAGSGRVGLAAINSDNSIWIEFPSPDDGPVFPAERFDHPARPGAVGGENIQCPVVFSTQPIPGQRCGVGIIVKSLQVTTGLVHIVLCFLCNAYPGSMTFSRTEFLQFGIETLIIR